MNIRPLVYVINCLHLTVHLADGHNVQKLQRGNL